MNKMAMSTESIPGSLDMKLKNTILIQRRAIILAILGSTASNNIALKSVLTNGALILIKSWLDDILSKSVGESLMIVTRRVNYLIICGTNGNNLITKASECNFTHSWFLEVVTFFVN